MKKLLLCFSIAATAWCAGTAAWEMNTYQEFVRGRFQGVSLSREGRLTLAPRIDTVFSSDQPVVWAIAQAPDGTLYVGTGHRGRVFEINKRGQSSVLWTADEPEVFAVAVDPKGVLYAATSPNGKIYRIQNGKATEYFDPKTKYIWSLAFTPEGTLYAGTGEEGKIFRIQGPGTGDLYYDTGQSHVTSLAVDREGRLLAGTEPNGILYQITSKDKAFVLYDSNLPEIHAVVSAADGSIYAAALGGSLAKRSLGGVQPVPGAVPGVAVTAPPTAITVTAEAAQSGAEIKPPGEPTKQPQAPAQPQVTTQFTPVVDISNVEKSALYKINPDHTVETLWTSKDENIYDLLALPGQILFSTDSNGRIYRLSPDRKVTLVVQTNESEATRLLASQSGILAATGNMGRVYRLGTAPGATGSYESPVHDASTVARWGRLSWRAEGDGIRFRTRTGNSARPDKTWSDWSPPLSDANGSPIPSPNARYIQWKAEFFAANGSNPVLESATIAYLPQNNPPVVKSIQISTQLAATPATKQPAQPSTAAYSVTVTDTGDAAAAATSTGTATQMLSRIASQQIKITWQAEDPDNDPLVYSLYFRGEGELEWKLLKANLREPAFLLDGDTLADGRYFFRVVASDREANPPSTAREAQLVSAPVWIDNTPPVVTLSVPRRSAAGFEIDFEASDAASPLRRCEYSVDAGPWTPVEAADGVIDSQREKFLLRLTGLAPGEHIVVVRVADSANNVGLGKLVLR